MQSAHEIPTSSARLKYVLLLGRLAATSTLLHASKSKSAASGGRFPEEMNFPRPQTLASDARAMSMTLSAVLQHIAPSSSVTTIRSVALHSTLNSWSAKLRGSLRHKSRSQPVARRDGSSTCTADILN